MAYEQKKITDLPSAITVFDNDIFTIIQGGTSTKQATAALLRDYISNYMTFTGTLTAGDTSITFTNENITEDSIIEDYYSKYGIQAKDITVSIGSVTLTFDALDYDLGVKVRIL